MREAPTDFPAERALIGAVIIEPEIFDDVAAIVSPEDFAAGRHTEIWNAIKKLKQEGKDVDVISVASVLSKQAKERNEWRNYLIRLSTSVPNYMHAETYAENVAKAAARRRTLKIAEEIAMAAYNDDIDIAEVTGQAADKLLNVSAVGVQDAIVSLEDAFGSIMRQEGAGAFVPVSLGNNALNDVVSAEKGTFNIVAARPGTGKTAYLLNVAFGSAKRGTKVVFLSGEMPTGQISSRLLAIISGVASKKISKYRGGKKSALSKKDLEAIAKAQKKYKDVIDRIHIVDATGMSWEKAMAAAAVAVRKTGAELLLVDYLGIFLGRVSKDYLRHGSVLAMTYISNSAKQLAGRLGVMLIAAHQLNRDVEKRADPRPVPSDLRDSGALEQDADTILFLYLPKDAKKPSDGYLVMFSLAKNRHGAIIPEGEFFFLPRVQRFVKPRGQQVDLTEAVKEGLPL